MTITPVLAPRARRAPIGQRRPLPLLGALTALAVLLSVVSLSIGASWIPISDSLRALAGDTSTDGAQMVANFQLPRVALAWCVGIALAVSGAVLQGIIRNPLAAPDIIGVTRGAGFAGMVLLIGLPQASFVFVAPAAFVGGLVAALLVYVLAYRRGASPTRLALVGIAVGAAFEAGIRFLLVRNPLDVNSALIWLTGSLFGRQLRDVLVILPVLAVVLPLVLRSAHRLDVLGLGDDMASGLGEAVESTRRKLLLYAVALAAVAVAVSGTIGFVGLIAPHIARRLFGGRHLVSVPGAAIIGVLILLVADAIGRGLMPPLEIPAGLVTAVVGGPYFLYLLVKTGR